MQALEPPSYPEALAYLHEWALDLVGRSGVGMGGASPVSHQEVEAWSRLTGHAPTFLEIEGIKLIDGVLRNPAPPEKEADELPASEPRVTKAWPTRKANG